MSVSGVASSIIAEHAAKDAAIVVNVRWTTHAHLLPATTKTPSKAATRRRTRSATTPSRVTWAISLPCPKDDLEWVQRALKAKSSRITARDMTHKLGENEDAAACLRWRADLERGRSS